MCFLQQRKKKKKKSIVYLILFFLSFALYFSNSRFVSFKALGFSQKLYVTSFCLIIFLPCIYLKRKSRKQMLVKQALWCFAFVYVNLQVARHPFFTKRCLHHYVLNHYKKNCELKLSHLNPLFMATKLCLITLQTWALILSYLPLISPIVFNYPAVFNFGDSNSDTGGLAAGIAFPVGQPNGQTYFLKPSGRFCDGRLIIDFLSRYLLIFFFFNCNTWKVFVKCVLDFNFNLCMYLSY